MCKKHLPKNVTRRDILRYTLAGAGVAALGSFGQGLIPVASGAPLVGHRRLVSLFGFGGYDGLNMLVPTTNQAYMDLRPTIKITSPLSIGETDYGLHPALSRLAGLFGTGEACAFRLVGYPNQNLSHFISQDIHSGGVRDSFEPLGIDPSGWIARYAQVHAPTPMGAAALGVGRPLEFEGGSSNPFMVGSLGGFRFLSNSIGSADHEHRFAALDSVLQNFSGDTVTTEAKNALDQGVQLSGQIQQAVTDYEDETTGSPFEDAYPKDLNGNRTTPGRYLRDAAILIRGGFRDQSLHDRLGRLGYAWQPGQRDGQPGQSDDPTRRRARHLRG